MKGKYITTHVRLAYLSKPVYKKDIHQQLAETIAEREQILQQLNRITKTARIIDMYIGEREAA